MSCALLRCPQISKSLQKPPVMCVNFGPGFQCEDIKTPLPLGGDCEESKDIVNRVNFGSVAGENRPLTVTVTTVKSRSPQNVSKASILSAFARRTLPDTGPRSPVNRVNFDHAEPLLGNPIEPCSLCKLRPRPDIFCFAKTGAARHDARKE